ncbi:hypothetical protein D3C71_1302450 [compost metagenome]
MEQFENFGQYFQHHRKILGVNKSEAGRRIGISAQYVNDIEEKNLIPSEEKIEIMVALFEMDEKTAFRLANKMPIRVYKKALEEYLKED